ncbi:DnaD domain protein [Oribacterium sp. oral taxon 102]|uniref:DnaD domain-containing protein n=1 Tax=Oribacterium sp. oral taxon 102 TaxID=671214 RepID=UPI0015B7B19F|nr:DnaD domain protein [Oribacterium sp. oral taxon 102]NWO20887.1 DnaD domain protein [Oribacterium sp. oral taxon 102]
MGTNIEDKLAVKATCISNEFLDKFMAEANGDYVKVYLYMLRHCGEKFNIKEAADALMLTDNDIERAVRYWEKMGVFSDGAGQCVESEIRTEAAFARSEELLSERASEDVSEEAQTERVQSEEEFAGVLFVAKHVLPGLPSQKQVETLEYMYRQLGMNAELIEFLLEYCAGLEKTSSRYMETVAINWHEQGIRTVKQAQQLIREFERRKSQPRKSVTKPNRFMNLEKSEVDYDSIAQKKVLERMNGIK